MKLSCIKENLVRAVQIVQKAVSNKPNMPILSGIYINAEKNSMELQATNYEIGIKCKIEAIIEEPGTIMLSGRYFQEVVRKLPGNTIIISTNQTDHTVQITSNTAQFNLLSLPTEEFPILQPIESTTNFTIRDNIFRDLIHKTAFACSTDESRPVFTGALLDVNDADVRMVATNTHRLAIKKEFLDHFTGTIKIIIPAKILNELARIATSDVPSDIMVNCNQNQISFDFDNIYIKSRLIEGNFPDYNRVIPSSFTTQITINTEEFTDAVERMSLISRIGDYNVINLSFKKDTATISSNNPEIGKAEETVGISLSGNELDISFNAKYITDILKNINSEKIYFSLNTALSPASIRPYDDESYNYIITPVRTNQ